MAAFKGPTETAQLLIDKKADVNQTNTNGATPLYLAVFVGHLQMTKLLISAGADVNQAETTDGTTPLYMLQQKMII